MQHRKVNPGFARRDLLAGGGLLAFSAMIGRGAAAALALTPPQTEGPFYPNVMPVDLDADLVRVTGKAAQALGTVTHLQGRVVDVEGRPIGGALVEIWQCDANGRYINTRDTGAQPRDGNFQGYGKVVVTADGAYRFRTIRPVPYTGRTPHIHVAVRVPGRPDLITQLYVEGDPGNARDSVWSRLSPEARALVTVPFIAAPEIEPQAQKASFTIVLA